MLIKYTLKYKKYMFIVFAPNHQKAVEQIENDLDDEINSKSVNIVAAIKII